MAKIRSTSAVLAAAFCLSLVIPVRATEWPKSDIPPDPAVTFGVLSNGMRYAIMHNGTPAGEVSVRLRIATGSMQESDAQRGLAHFLEHMAFRGSTHVADGEIDKTLERLGLRFGADTNASTDQDQTIYQFDLPGAGDKTVDTVLGYTREIAGDLTLSPAAAATEAGVVLSELRLRDSPAARALQAELDFALRDPHATTLPSGNPAIIAKAPVADIRAYYQAYYRPERATLIVVGDVDPARIVAKIKDRFSGWKGVGIAGTDPRLDIPRSGDVAARLYVEPGARDRVSLLWVAPPEPKPDDKAQEKAELIESMALQILNRRFQAAAASANPPFTAAGASSDQVLHAAKLVRLSIGYEPGQWQPALAAVEKLRLGALQAGVTQAEVDRAVAEFHASFQSGAAGASTRLSPRIVNSLLSNISANDVFTSPERDLATVDADLKDLTAEQVTGALRKVFGDAPPSIFMSSPQAVEGGEEAIKTALLQIEATPVVALPSADQQARLNAWSYTDFGKPGIVAETHQAADVGTTFVRFTNGVRLTIRPSKLRSNQVLVAVKVGGGRLELPKDRATVAWAAGALIAGGLKDLPYDDMQRILVGKRYQTNFGVGEDGFVFVGSTSPDDIDTQLQVFAAYLESPAFRPEGLLQVKSRYAARLRQGEDSAGAIIQLKAPEFLHDGDKRWATPTPQEVQGARVEDLSALLAPAFQSGPLDITIVGDITTDKAVQSVAATFGALPARAQTRAILTAQNDTHLPTDAVPIDVTGSRQKTQIVASVVWPTHGQSPDIRDNATLQLMSSIMQDRLFDKLRGLGVAYTARVGAASSKVFDYGYIQAQSQLQPEKAPQFYEALHEIITDLEAGKITADDLDRARNPALQELQRARQSNEYWLAALDGAQENPHALDMPRTYESALRQVTLSDIQAAARKYLAEPRMIRLTAAS